MSTDLIKRLRDALACKLRQNGFEAANGPLVRTTEQLRVLVEADAHLLSAAVPDTPQDVPQRCLWAVTKGGLTLCQPPKSQHALATLERSPTLKYSLNHSPGAEAPFTSNSTETVMMSYGGSPSPKQMLDRIATLERENAELVEKVKRTRGSCNKLAKLLRDSERFIKDPSDKYAALAREHLLKAIDAALQPKEPTNG